jgi:hypothetical protein
MVLFRLFDRSIGIVSTTLLARLLLPADFGLVAMAMSVIAVIELATAFSFEVALIQKADPRREDFDTAWTLNVLISIGGALLTVALGAPAATFYGDPRLTAVMLAIGAAWLVSGFENIGTVNFRRTMDFGAEFRFMASKRVIAFAVTISAALAFQSYWALVIGMTTSRLAGLALSYSMQPFRPRFSLASARDLFSFSGWLLASNIATVLLQRVPHFFVGRAFGAQTLGRTRSPRDRAPGPHGACRSAQPAMFPGYSRSLPSRSGSGECAPRQRPPSCGGVAGHVRDRPLRPAHCSGAARPAMGRGGAHHSHPRTGWRRLRGHLEQPGGLPGTSADPCTDSHHRGASAAVSGSGLRPIGSERIRHCLRRAPRGPWQHAREPADAAACAPLALR